MPLQGPLRPEIVEMIKAINPRKIVPIHTEHPDHPTSHFNNVIKVEQGAVLTL